MVKAQIKKKALLSTLVLLTAVLLVFGLVAPAPVQAKSANSILIECIGYVCIDYATSCYASGQGPAYYCTNYCTPNGEDYYCNGDSGCQFGC